MVCYLLMDQLPPEYNTGILESLRLKAQNNDLCEKSLRTLNVSKH